MARPCQEYLSLSLLKGRKEEWIEGKKEEKGEGKRKKESLGPAHGLVVKAARSHIVDPGF